MFRSLVSLSLVGLSVVAIACGGTSDAGVGAGAGAADGTSDIGSSAGSGAGAPAGEARPLQPGDRAGAFETRIVDAPNRDVTEIWVTVTKVTVHSSSGGWQTIGTVTKTIDLLKLQNGTFTSLGVAQWPAGKITQFRMYVAEAGPNYVTTPDGAHHDLKVPSGEESGLKFKGGFELDGCSTGVVTFDFDGKKSIMVHPKGAGAGDEWILRPVVKLKSLVYRGKCGGGSGGGSGTSGGGTTSGGTSGGGTTSGGTSGGGTSGGGTTSGGTSGGTTTSGGTSGGTTTSGGTSGGGTTSGSSTAGGGDTSGGGGSEDPTLMYPDVQIDLPDLCGGVTCGDSQYCSNGVCAKLY